MQGTVRTRLMNSYDLCMNKFDTVKERLRNNR